jgi:hypothetical protein
MKTLCSPKTQIHIQMIVWCKNPTIYIQIAMKTSNIQIKYQYVNTSNLQLKYQYVNLCGIILINHIFFL